VNILGLSQDGLRLTLCSRCPSEVVVSAPHRPPRVVRRSYPDGPVALLALPAPANHAAVLAAARLRRPSVVDHDARRLLGTGATVFAEPFRWVVRRSASPDIARQTGLE
jgi:hypothetical protein